MDAIYTDRILASLYDVLNPHGPDTDFYLRNMPASPARVLDIGCGTGLLAAALAARGHDVTGIDPAPAMLDIARGRRHGGRVRWIAADARTLDLPLRYDVILMTGHVFQVFLDETDAAAVLRLARRHLAENGRLYFETRNPAAAAWADWTPASSLRVLDHPDLGRVETWHVVTESSDPLVRFTSFYRIDGEAAPITSESVLAFRDAGTVGDLLEQAGFHDIEWFGNWDGAPLTSRSPEIIVRAS